MADYRRRLPHDHPAGQALFLTWHLHGSLPHARYPPPGAVNAGKAFVWMDRYLDTTRTGPQYLRRDEVARAVTDAIAYASRELRYYDLHAWVIMPNHVHLLITPLAPLSKLLKSVKNFRRGKRTGCWAAAVISGNRNLMTTWCGTLASLAGFSAISSGTR